MDHLFQPPKQLNNVWIIFLKNLKILKINLNQSA